MSLHPDAQLTQAEQDAVDVLRETLIGKTIALAAAQANLDQFLRDRCTADVGMMFDFYGDGELKPTMEIVRPGGQRPAIISEKITEQRANGAHPPDTPPPAATQGVRAQAQALYSNRQQARAQYDAAGQALNGRLNHLMYRNGCSSNCCVDVFGDGLVKPHSECTWPPGVQLFKGRFVKL